ncbi:DNA-directed RNA polymerase subunit alpha [Treponema vincentii]|jgi:DNA-directed RNA polymerase, alpha subunit|uniref:DNA-directed RNA polymerase subunit alpha n=1 Tax=Treponema vincentii ATCC 35580 TaxID=596324 RepID=C8PPB5_9SPIR|nr:DNA-directed RNA polymerase subunit alpha [Treponema vincentii]EEV20687.1 DNA-directed RNA polymerase, alpha subunit [Treponema vincentii ATCC 35580]UTC45269.1 DNA-directed RNA polymerase subunit alpha [Treponema vincentii]UTC47575.1 DNA-directed RNA polymerase subunit alpha [Treponema vincentii]UTC60209.1 DNA-directed RNA polymerase subunit alpha [Treponema vincentii]
MARKNLLKGFKKPKGLEFAADVSNDSYGKFTASPFETGFGTTIGNCLRRVLLSSIQGYAISAVKITSYGADDVPHSISSEFEAIPNVTEDTMEVLNNLKQMRLRLPNEIEQDTFLFDFKGPRSVKAADFAKPGQLEILSGDLHIMELMENAHVELEVQVDFGRGYVPAETNEKYVEVVGTISLDTIFSPVRKVSYEIQPCRVGQRNDYDKLVLEIWTDGTIRPEDALAEAAKIAKEHFTVFVNFNENELLSDDEADESDEMIKQLLDTPITELDLSVRASNCLKNANVSTIRDLTMMTEDEISKTRNVGKKSLQEIQEKLAERNLSLGMTDYSHLKNSIKLSRQKEETDEA